MKASKEHPVICWWSGGITSAIACRIAIDEHGVENCRVIFLGTGNEDDNTYRFALDCENWYGIPIETISVVGEGKKYSCIQDVWIAHKSLNVAKGAICSAVLKRDVRLRWQKDNDFSYQVFGFDMSEPMRAVAMMMNYPEARPIFPLLQIGKVVQFEYTKQKCADILGEAGISIPAAYKLGFNNNNCLKTGCVQGGIGYWQKMRREFPEKFFAMAKMEHKLTDLKGEPVTMLKNRGKGIAKGALLFLLPHPDYPEIADISTKKGREPKPLNDCMGFCGVNDLMPRTKTEMEINYQQSEIDFG